mgnify:CR=1 FL=1
MEINLDKLGGLVPAIVQDADTDKVLMLGFMLLVGQVLVSVQWNYLVIS